MSSFVTPPTPTTQASSVPTPRPLRALRCRRHGGHNDQREEKLCNKDVHADHEPTILLRPGMRRRSGMVSAVVVGATAMLEARRPVQIAQAAETLMEINGQQRWGTRSFIKEKYFQPQLSPEESVARIRQTTEGLREMRHMLETMSWRYVMFYIRLKSAYLDSDLKNAMSTVPTNLRKSYVKTANDVVDNMSEVVRIINPLFLFILFI